MYHSIQVSRYKSVLSQLRIVGQNVRQFDRHVINSSTHVKAWPLVRRHACTAVFPVPRFARMSLLLNRPTTAAVQGVSQAATVECRRRIAEFRNLLQQTLQVTVSPDTSRYSRPAHEGSYITSHILTIYRKQKAQISKLYGCGLLVLPHGFQT